MSKKNIYKLCIIGTLFLIIILFSVRFFCVDLSNIATDLDKDIHIKYDNVTEDTKVASTLLGFIVYTHDGIKFAKTCISGSHDGIKILRDNNGKYLVVFNTKYSENTKFELINKIKKYRKTINERVIDIETIRSYTSVNPEEVSFYKKDNIYRIVAPNRNYKKLDTMNVVYFENLPTQNGYDVEIYYDFDNTYYIITEFNKEELVYLQNGKIVPPSVDVVETIE